MKTVAPVLFLAALFGAQQAGIEGVVLNQATGEPLHATALAGGSRTLTLGLFFALAIVLEPMISCAEC